MKVLRDAACEYADRGWAVLPLNPRSKVPLGSLVPHGMDEATTDLGQVFGWWEEWPWANIGINCEKSGLVVLDIDPRNDGEDSFHDLLLDLGKLPPTVEAHSGGGGQHLLFRHPGGDFRREITSGVDIKCSGYIVAPPSIHPDGKPYVWSVDGDPGEVEVADLPKAWQERMRAPRRRLQVPEANRGTTDRLKHIPAGRYASVLTGREIDEWGWMQCPFHRNGQERTPSFKVDGTLWCCYACEPQAGKHTHGGNCYDLAGQLWGFSLPLTPNAFGEVRDKLLEQFS